ncbi:MAG: RNA 3'-terminal phosphate cyclase [Alphaproteobacteria bacterium]
MKREAPSSPFRIEKIRAGRKQPGLLRQHLPAVRRRHKWVARRCAVMSSILNGPRRNKTPDGPGGRR